MPGTLRPIGPVHPRSRASCDTSSATIGGVDTDGITRERRAESRRPVARSTIAPLIDEAPMSTPNDGWASVAFLKDNAPSLGVRRETMRSCESVRALCPQLVFVIELFLRFVGWVRRVVGAVRPRHRGGRSALKPQDVPLPRTVGRVWST